MRRLVAVGVCSLWIAAGLTPARAADDAEDRVAATEDERRDAARDDDDAPADVDDTGKNVRDRAERALTPMDQGSSEGDRTITAEIRRMVTENDELSTNAKNVKIITQDGVVTLRGPVKNEAEKTTVSGIARRAAGVKRVDDQLEVERNP